MMIPGERKIGIRSARPLIIVVGVALLAALLAGCHSDAYYDAQAPSPTINPSAHKYSHLKITTQPGSGVDRVEVHSIWTIDNIGCAPRRWPSGSTIQKQMDVKEQVEKIDGYYLATILDDRYLPGKCRWDGDGYDIRFFRGRVLYGHTGVGPNDFETSNVLNLTCVPTEPKPFYPQCFMRDRETFMRNHFSKVFNASVETMK